MTMSQETDTVAADPTEWPGRPDAPGYALRPRGDGRVAVIAPDLHAFDSAASPGLARHLASRHWASLTPGARDTVARSGLRVLQRRIERVPIARDVHAAALLVLYLEPEDRCARVVVDDARWANNDASRAHMLAAARRLAPRRDFPAGGPRERLEAYLAALQQDGQPRWFLTPEAWRDLASMAGAVSVLRKDARLAELSCRVSADGENVSLSASEIDEVVQALRAAIQPPRPKRRR